MECNLEFISMWEKFLKMEGIYSIILIKSTKNYTINFEIFTDLDIINHSLYLKICINKRMRMRSYHYINWCISWYFKRFSNETVWWSKSSNLQSRYKLNSRSFWLSNLSTIRKCWCYYFNYHKYFYNWYYGLFIRSRLRNYC